MMTAALYHLTPEGEARLCRANLRPCPYGGEHYATAEQARLVYEQSFDVRNLRQKYPRTKHLPSSRSMTDDDRIATVAEVEEAFTETIGGVRVPRRVVITEKMDGENTTIYPDGHSHARSIDSKFHPSRSIVREHAGQVQNQLPPTYRICGENLFARHSIAYDSLPSHFQVFSLWDGDRCLPWDETKEWAELLDLHTVSTLYDGPWVSEDHCAEVWQQYKDNLPEGQESEGFVVRRASGFSLKDFGKSLMKLVRENHVQTGSSTHWMNAEMVVNKLSG